MICFLQSFKGWNYRDGNRPGYAYNVPVGTLNTLQIQTNNTVLNTNTNTLIPGVFGNTSGIYFNGTIFG